MEELIFAKQLVKEFKQPIRKEGIFSSIRTLFNSQYNIKRAVNGISFTINEGEIVGYIGPNGAGKSTTIKMLTGILVPTSGQIEVDGLVPYKNRKEYCRNIGVVFGQKSQLWWDVPVIESLKLLKDIYKVSDENFRKNMDIFCDLLELHKFHSLPVRQLSLGQRMRADLAAALLHDPKILFLDEPTIGVDLVTKEKLRIFIKEINVNKKVTILLTTHDMNDIEKLCSRVMIINNGQLIYEGNMNRIRTVFGEYRTLIVRFDKQVPDFSIDEAELIKTEGTQKWFRFNRNTVSVSELINEICSKFHISDLSIEEPDIEETIRTIYEGRPVGQKR